MVLVFDIETETFGKPDASRDVFKYLGAYSYKDDKYYFLNDKQEIDELFKKHRVIVGFNSSKYDEPILRRSGLMKYRHTHIDLREVVKKREVTLKCRNESKSLSNLAHFFDLSVFKGELDYTLLRKKNLTESEYELIREYTLQDIKVTREMFEYLCKFFEHFKNYMKSEDVRNYKWLTSSIGAYSYKVICHLTGIKEEYSDKVDYRRYEGGFVAEPECAEEHDDVYCLDFNSLYSHIFMQANLYSWNCKCCKDEEKWSGNELFPLSGKYCTKKMGKIESLLKDLYQKRLEYKKNKDKREFVLKVVLNTIYGLSGSYVFKNLYNYETASDCTLIARNCCKFARKRFRDAGYKILYSDTDSVYLKDVYKDEERLMMVKSSAIDYIKKNLLFPQKTFDMGIDERIKHIWFFKENDKFLKKFYLFVDENEKITVKGLPLIKNDSSRVGYLIFNKYMSKSVIQGTVKFKKSVIEKWLHKEIENDLNVITRKFRVNDIKDYKNTTSIQYQISNQYGVGTHYLIPNGCCGVGKGVKYCSVEEFKKRNMGVEHLFLNKFWNEMKYFLVSEKNGGLSAWTNI